MLRATYGDQAQLRHLTLLAVDPLASKRTVPWKCASTALPFLCEALAAATAA